MTAATTKTPRTGNMSTAIWPRVKVSLERRRGLRVFGPSTWDIISVRRSTLACDPSGPRSSPAMPRTRVANKVPGYSAAMHPRVICCSRWSIDSPTTSSICSARHGTPARNVSTPPASVPNLSREFVRSRPRLPHSGGTAPLQPARSTSGGQLHGPLGPTPWGRPSFRRDGASPGSLHQWWTASWYHSVPYTMLGRQGQPFGVFARCNHIARH